MKGTVSVQSTLPDKVDVFLAVIPEREVGAANRFLVVEGLDGVACYIALGETR